MTFLVDGCIVKLAQCACKEPGKIASNLMRALISKNVIEVKKEFFGLPFKICWNENALITDVVEALHEVGVKDVKCEHIDALCDATVFGEDDCPDCGGKMDVIDGDSVIISGDGYFEPFEYKTIWEELCCPICGHKQRNYYE